MYREPANSSVTAISTLESGYHNLFLSESPSTVVPIYLGQSINDSVNSPDNSSNPTIDNSTIDFAGAGRDNHDVDDVDDVDDDTLNDPSPTIDEASVKEDTIDHKSFHLNNITQVLYMC